MQDKSMPVSVQVAGNGLVYWLSWVMRFTQIHRAVSLLLVVVLAILVSAKFNPSRAQQKIPVGLELALLVDVSASVNSQEYRKQVLGLAAAFRTPAIVKAVADSGGIVVCVIQWAQEAFQFKSVDWTHLNNQRDAMDFAIRIASIKRPFPSGQTAIGNALDFAMTELNTNRFEGLRRVIDLSGDGKSNDGLLLRPVRERVVNNGITINALAILNEVPELAEYFQARVIGGQDAFVMTALDYTDFARAMNEKLEREIRPVPVAGNFNTGKFATAFDKKPNFIRDMGKMSSN